MADNQITPFQLTDQFTMDNFNQRINETNIALQKKADSSSVYTKEESISAATRTALSLAETATPDAALAEIARQLSNILTVEIITQQQMDSWFASGYHLSGGSAYRLYDGTLILYLSISASSLVRGNYFMTIPEGYRPMRQIKFTGVVSKSNSTEYPIAFAVEADGGVCPLASESNVISASILLYYPTGGVNGG